MNDALKTCNCGVPPWTHDAEPCPRAATLRQVVFDAGDELELDLVNHPPHYTAHPSGVECITITEHFSFNIGNAIKYLWRADEKGAPIDDLRKARWYVDREIQRRERAAAGGAA